MQPCTTSHRSQARGERGTHSACRLASATPRASRGRWQLRLPQGGPKSENPASRPSWNGRPTSLESRLAHAAATKGIEVCVRDGNGYGHDGVSQLREKASALATDLHMLRLQEALHLQRDAGAPNVDCTQHHTAFEADAKGAPLHCRPLLADSGAADASPSGRRRAQVGLSRRPARVGSAQPTDADIIQFTGRSHPPPDQQAGERTKTPAGWSDPSDLCGAVGAAAKAGAETQRLDRLLNLMSRANAPPTPESPDCPWEQVRSQLGAALQGLAAVPDDAGWHPRPMSPGHAVAPTGSPGGAPRRDLDEAREAAFRAEAEWWAAEQRARDAWQKLQMQEALTSDDSDSELEPTMLPTCSRASFFWGDV